MELLFPDDEGTAADEMRFRLSQRAEEVLDLPRVWRAVEALAEALFERREIAGDEAVRIMDEVFDQHTEK